MITSEVPPFLNQSYLPREFDQRLIELHPKHMPAVGEERVHQKEIEAPLAGEG